MPPPSTYLTAFGLSRDQFAQFLKNHEQIKQFENLFAEVNGLSSTVYTTMAALEGKIGELSATIDEQRKAIEGLQSAPPPKEPKRTRYGSFYDTTVQAAAAINTAKEITFNTTDMSYGVYVGSPASRIYVDTEGVYNFQMSIQLDSTVSTDEEFYIWFRKNGSDVTDSASQVRVKGNNAEVFLSLNYFFDLKAGDYIELMFSVTDLGVRLLSVAAAAPHPGIASIILTVSNNIRSY